MKSPTQSPYTSIPEQQAAAKAAVERVAPEVTELIRQVLTPNESGSGRACGANPSATMPSEMLQRRSDLPVPNSAAGVDQAFRDAILNDQALQKEPLLGRCRRFRRLRRKCVGTGQAVTTEFQVPTEVAVSDCW
jgi:hypothetical protein